MQVFRSIRLCGLASLLTLAGAANAATTEGAHQNAPTAAPVVKKAKVVKVRKFTPLSRKPSGADADAEFRLEGTPQVGLALPVTLRIHASADVKYSVRVDQTLLLRSVSGNGVAAANQTTNSTIVVVPQSEGRHYVYISLEQEGRRTNTSFAVQVGTERALPQKPAQTGPNGEKVIIMQAK